MSWGDEIRAWFAAHPGEHTIAEFCDAIGEHDRKRRKRYGSEASKIVTLGHLARTDGQPRRYSFLRHATPHAERMARMTEKSANKRRLLADVRAAHQRAYEARYRRENAERLNRRQQLARLRRGDTKSLRVRLTPEEQAQRKAEREQRERARLAARAERNRIKREAERMKRVQQRIQADAIKAAARRIKEDGAFSVSAAKAPPTPKHDPSETERWLAANPGGLIRLAPGETSQPRDRLSPAQRRMVMGLEVAAA